MLLPGLAFSSRNPGTADAESLDVEANISRLGRGGGYYDRYLADYAGRPVATGDAGDHVDAREDARVERTNVHGDADVDSRVHGDARASDMPLLYALAFQEQLVDRVPTENTDFTLNGIVYDE